MISKLSDKLSIARTIRDNKGLTAVELLIVIITLIILAAIFIPKVTALIAKRKAMRDMVIINRLVSGIGKFYSDCGTYPITMKVLVSNQGISTSDTLNGSDPTNCWAGPYISASNYSSSDDSIQGAFGTANRITIHISTSAKDINGDGLPDYYIELTKVPQDMAEELEKKIDNDDANDSDAKSGKWVYNCQGGLCTCDFVFRELNP